MSAYHTTASVPMITDADAGVGFKHAHAEAVFGDDHAVRWFEVHPENYMGAGGMPHRLLTDLRERFGLSLHGVGLSIGGEGRLDADHLARLVALNERYAPDLFSEHLAWSSHDESYLNDLLPLPYTPQTVAKVADHIDEVQSALGRTILLENPSTYVVFEQSEMSETDFLREIVRRTGCGLLLDVNNVFVSATNHGTSAQAYLDAFPTASVGEIHLAGHASVTLSDGAPLLIDAHDRAVADPVWDLYENLIARIGPRPTLVEWDNDVPAFDVLAGEVARAQAVLDTQSPLLGRRHVA
ncbi:MAG: DUF692 domain-containing protein [Devosiaceae bacterium]|nr:DUF692 domain-containing protein [Devosiaceae bacterium MH13]